jgi:Mg-chelatase subunit ChlI
MALKSLQQSLKDRFDLEADILALDYAADEIDLVVQAYAEDSDTDRHINALIGIAELIRLRTQRAFDTFKQAYNLKE